MNDDPLPPPRIITEVVPASIMSRQERLDDLEYLIKQIEQYAVRPSQYRSEHYKAIHRLCSVARTLFWKEKPV